MLLSSCYQGAGQLFALANVCASSPSSWRCLSVLAWGRNVEGQCGVEGQVPLVARPTAILDLHQAPVSAVSAGKLSSGAVVRGDMYTWGHGAAGKLGLGSGESVLSPSRVEAFIGRTPIRAASLGHHHTLFLDKGGQLWACGENKEGQCGLGVPLEVLASQHRRVYDSAMAALITQNRPSTNRYTQYLRTAVASGANEISSSQAEVPHVAQGWGSLWDSSSSSSSTWGRSRGRLTPQQQQQQQPARRADVGGSWGLGKAQDRSSLSAAAAVNGPDVYHTSSSGSGLAGSLFSNGSSSSRDPLSSLGGMLMGSIGLQEHLNAAGLQAGQIGTPARVGAAQSSSLLLGATNEGADAAAVQGSLATETVVGMAASKYFSLAVTAKGEVWAFGADYNGALGSTEASWLSSARRVSAPIADALAAAGGAVAVAAGGTFGAAVTTSGTVLVWGGSPATPGLSIAAAADSGHMMQHSSSGAGRDAASGAMFAEVQLPEGVRISSISAGQQHLLLTDGWRVWVVGRYVDASGQQAGVASWQQPHQVLLVPQVEGSGILKVAAGMHSSAAVTQDGKLWLWGRLVDEQHGLGIVRRFGGEQHVAGVDWGWAGFGGAAPTLVEEVQGVRDVALGGWHALVVVD